MGYRSVGRAWSHPLGCARLVFGGGGFRHAVQARTPCMFDTIKATCTKCGKGTVKHKVTLTKCGAILHPAKCYRCGHKWE